MSRRIRIDAAERRALLGVHHRLTHRRRTNDVVAIAEDLVALHSSDPASVYLSVAARMVEPSLDPLASALYDDHTLIRHHAMRRTLFVFPADVARSAHAACTTALVRNQRRALIAQIEASGVAEDGAAWLEVARRDVLAALRSRGQATARQLGQMVPALQDKLHLAVGKSYASFPAAHTRVLLLLGFEGEIVRGRPTGSWINSEYHWADMTSWLGGTISGMDPDDAATDLVRRWLRSYGPGTTADVQWWTGWTGAATKKAIAATGAVEVDADGEPGWVLRDGLDGLRDQDPWVALLPGLDPTTMGWKRRDWYLSPEHVPLLFDRNGNAGPTIWVDGRVAGGWVQRRTGEIAWRLLADVGRERTDEIERAAATLEELLGPTRFSVRFPVPLQAELL